MQDLKWFNNNNTPSFTSLLDKWHRIFSILIFAFCFLFSSSDEHSLGAYLTLAIDSYYISTVRLFI